MNIQFVKLQLHNFASYKDSVIDLNEMGFALVEGRNRCKLDNAYSNGSGKSAIFNGLCYALTGETVQGISTGIENIFTDPEDCWVQVTFFVDGDEFVVRRIKTPRNNMTIFINGEDCSGKGIRESSQVLANYLPDLTPELVSSIIILGQGLPHRFTNNKPARRKEILETLTKSDFMIQAIKDKLEIRMADLRNQLRAKEDLTITNESQLKVYNNRLDSLTEQLDEYNAFGEGELSARVEALTAEVKDITDKKEANLVELEKENNKLNELSHKSTSIINEREEALNTELTKLKDNLEELNTKVNELNADYTLGSKELKALKAITDICPTCGQKIPDVNKPDTTQKEKELEELNTKLKAAKEEKEEAKKLLTSEEKRIKAEYQNKLNELDSSIELTTEVISGYKSLNQDYRCKLDTLNFDLNRYTNLQDNYNKLINDLAEVNKQIDTITQTESANKVDKVNLGSHIEIVQQMITLAKREFRGILLSNVIKFIDKKVKQYSKEVFGTDKLSFTLDENNIDITYCDKLYENLSGGEKQKIDIIIQLALRDILSKQLNIHSNLLVLDEIYDNADAISCQKITNLISTLTDIDSIFIISHHVQDLGITYDNKVLVEKDEGGISNISFA